MGTAENLEKFRDLLEGKGYAHLATLMPDGSPQVTPVWFDYDGTYILISTLLDRVKGRNVTRDPRVSVEIMDPANPGRYVQIRGRVVELDEANAMTQVHKLARKYTGEDFQWIQPGERRVILKILPEHVSG